MSVKGRGKWEVGKEKGVGAGEDGVKKLSTSESKKRAGKKRNSPQTPYREKGPRKEINPGVLSTGLYACERPRGRAALLRRCVSAAVEDALRIFHGSRGPSPSDEALWANFAWTFSYGLLQELTRQGEAEMASHFVAAADKPKVLENLIKPFWNARSPKGGK